MLGRQNLCFFSWLCSNVMFWFSQDRVAIQSSNCTQQVNLHSGCPTFCLHYLHQLLQARALFRGEQAGMEVTAVPIVIWVIRVGLYSKEAKESNEYMYEQTFIILINAQRWGFLLYSAVQFDCSCITDVIFLHKYMTLLVSDIYIRVKMGDQWSSDCFLYNSPCDCSCFLAETRLYRPSFMARRMCL